MFSIKVRVSTKYLHTITDDANRFTLCLNTIMRTCERFQHDEMLCSHTVAAFRYRNKTAKIIVSNKNFQDTYAISIESLPCEYIGNIPTHILKVIIIPPISRKKPGRLPGNDR